MTKTPTAPSELQVEFNVNEFFSDHYLGSIFVDDVKQLTKAWKDDERDGVATMVSELIRLAGEWDELASDEPEDETVPDRNDRVLAALGYTIERRVLERELRGAIAQIPVAATVEVGGSTDLIVLEGRDARSIDDAFDPADRGTLLEPITTGTTEIASNRDAIDALYGLEHPPRFVLLATGNLLVLTERAKWAENRSFAIATAELLSGRKGPERARVERVAALAGCSSLVPDAGDAFFDQITLSAHKHATAISDDLRDAVRDSVEILANEVLERRRASGLKVLPDDDADELKRQCLRVLYRLLFLLFAEARPAMQLLPARDSRYIDGYGLDRLRDLADIELVTVEAQDGTHLHESIWKLFELITTDQTQSDRQSFDGAAELAIDRLDSDLFLPRATSIINQVKLGNETWQHVLQKLTLSKRQAKRQRQYLSYAGLGINQLGAVYERIMSYTGHFCRHDMYEVMDPSDTTKEPPRFLVRTDRADDYPEPVFLKIRSADDATDERIVHPKGTFVLRLSGRDRQQSASFYTPEVLTECVVRHGLSNLLDQHDTPTAADDLLQLTICEPAMGSGAFLNEAINQLAAEYLNRKQAELGENLDHEDYQLELQKTKAHFALHQAYGVDLNSAAVELAEVSLWLNCMARDLDAPWFGLHLRTGNSLIGARRDVYSPAELTSNKYLKQAPTHVPLGTVIPKGAVHHFLLPAAGWVSAADHADGKKIAGDDCTRLRDWRRTVTKRLAPAQVGRAQALAERVEEHWQRAISTLNIAERELRRPLRLYGQEVPEGSGAYARQQIEDAFRDPESSLSRLRAVMNLWCDLWFVTPIADESDAAGIELPTVDEWFDLLESILGTHSIGDAHGRASALQFDFDWLLAMQSDDRERGASGELARLTDLQVDWYRSDQRLYPPGRFFHWELEFGHIFQRSGGFDLQVGNPPWVRPKWDIALTLADLDPFHVVAARNVGEVTRRVPQTLERFPSAERHYLREAAYIHAVAKFLGSEITYPVLAGLTPNTYTNFISLAWRNAAPTGVQSLLHQLTHFLAPKGQVFRAENYGRLVEVWDFDNEAKLFPIHNETTFAIAVYGPSRDQRSFQYATQLHVVPTLESSLHHDGRGDLPAVQFEDGSGYDRRPHADRVMTIDQTALASMGQIMDGSDTPPSHARLMRPYLRGDLSVIEKLGRAKRRLGDLEYRVSQGWNETNQKKDGTMRWETTRPASWDEVILQGPHFAVGTPFAKEPNPGCRSNKDWSPVDLVSIKDDFIPRTNYQVDCGHDEYISRQRVFWGDPESSFARLAFRRMISPPMYRTNHPTLIPPGVMHVDAVCSMAFADIKEALVVLGTWCALPFDGVVKLAGVSKMNFEFNAQLPVPDRDDVNSQIANRAMRLYLVTSLLREQAKSPDTAPVVDDFGRRELMVELDALVGLGLGLDIEELITLYRSQFPVLRKYEYEYRFDTTGRQVPKDIWKAYEKDPSGADLAGYQLPFRQVNREAEIRANYERFADELGGPVA